MELWDSIRNNIEKVEFSRVEQELIEMEVRDQMAPPPVTFSPKQRLYLELIGAFAVGLSMAILATIFNYLVLVWFLHIEF